MRLTPRSPILLIALLAACVDQEPAGPAPDVLAAAVASVDAQGFRTTRPHQAELLVAGEMVALATVGDIMPGSGERLVGIPDGLGAFGDGRFLDLYMNHEIPVESGGARVSRFSLDARSGTILRHEYAVEAAAGYGKLCSGSWNDARDGFPGGYFFAGEETPRGVQLAIDRQGRVTELPWLGYYAHEQQVAVPGFRGHVVVVNFDDDGALGADGSTENSHSELYMYAARSARGVLTGRGTLHVFTSDDARHVGEIQPGQTIDGRWIPVPEDIALDRGMEGERPPLDAWVDAPEHDAFDFGRLEDGFYDKVSAGRGEPAVYFFDSGNAALGRDGVARDRWGSIYRLTWVDSSDPGGRVRLSLLARSNGPSDGWASPDNGDMNAAGVIMLQEDRAEVPWTVDEARIFALQRAPDGSLVDPVGTPVARTVGSDCVGDSGGHCWETSGIVDASRWFGAHAWLFDVQSKRPLADCPECVADGQLLLMRLDGS